MAFIYVNRIIQIKSNNNTRFEIQDDNSIKIEKVTEDNIEDARWFNSNIEDFYKFLKKGYKGYYAYYNNKCVSRLWLFTDSDRTYLDKYFLYRLREGEAYVTWGETAEDFRGLGIFNKISKFLMNDNPQYKILGSVDINNKVSLALHFKLSYYIPRKYLLIKIWKIKISIQYYGKLKNFRIKFGSYV